MYRTGAEQGPPTLHVEVDHLLCDEEWAAFEIWAVATETRTESAPRFGVFHKWNDGKLVCHPCAMDRSR